MSLCHKHCNHMCYVFLIDTNKYTYVAVLQALQPHVLCVLIDTNKYTYVAVLQALQPHVLCVSGAARQNVWNG